MSYRPSLHPGTFAASAASSTSGLTPAKANLLEKQREYAAFATVCAQSEQLAAYLAKFADQYDVLDGGSEAVGDVVEHWQNVFRATGLALASLANKRAALAPATTENGTPVNPADVELPPGTLPDKFVRIPVQQPEETLASPSS
ncbi:hypothetical protein JCM10213_006406 [Rhodosporidiobolus nylandii]